MLESINEQFFGSLDDIGIWDRALNENEVFRIIYAIRRLY